MSPNAAATEACVPQGLCSATREAIAMRRWRTATGEEPLPAHHSQRKARAVTETQHSQK